MKHRNFDGSDVMHEESIVDQQKHPDASQNPQSEDGVAFTQEQISWFGMTPCFYRGSSKGSKSVTNM